MKRACLQLTILALVAVGAACNEPIETEVEVIGTAGVGQSFYLAIKIDADTPTEDTYGSCFDMLYDTAKMSFTGTVQINQGAGFSFDYETHNYRNGQTDRLVVCVSKEGQVAGDNGAGELVRLQFQGVATGWTTVSFDEQYLIYSTGNNGPIEMSDKSIDIQ